MARVADIDVEDLTPHRWSDVNHRDERVPGRRTQRATFLGFERRTSAAVWRCDCGALIPSVWWLNDWPRMCSVCAKEWWK